VGQDFILQADLQSAPLRVAKLKNPLTSEWRAGLSWTRYW